MLSVVSQHRGLFMQEGGMLISTVLIMIGGAVVNASAITISHLHYWVASNSFTVGCFGKTSAALIKDYIYLPPKQTLCWNIQNDNCESHNSTDISNIFYSQHHPDAFFPFRFELESIMASSSRYKLNRLFLEMSPLLVLIAGRPLFSPGSYNLVCFTFI